MFKLNNYNSVYIATLIFCILNSLMENNKKLTFNTELFFIQIISNFLLEKINFAYGFSKMGNNIDDILFGIILNAAITIFCFIFVFTRNKNKFLKIYFFSSIALHIVAILIICYKYLSPVKIEIINMVIIVSAIYVLFFVYFMIDIICLCLLFLLIGKKYIISKYSLVLFCIFSLMLRSNLLYL